ncbi:MAG TPA: aspartyl protease family protein [Stellaceae bacterium]|nr:aspartyl protease family protein [Stellaceae bacterium]
MPNGYGRPITIKHDATADFSSAERMVLIGPKVLVDIGLDPQYRRGQNRPPNLVRRNLTALIDTGAMESCIDSQLAAELGLPIIDKTTVVGVHGPKSVNLHLGHIYIPQLSFPIAGELAGVDLRSMGYGFDALIGRESLSALKMTYDGPSGTVTLGLPD